MRNLVVRAVAISFVVLIGAATPLTLKSRKVSQSVGLPSDLTAVIEVEAIYTIRPAQSQLDQLDELLRQIKDASDLRLRQRLQGKYDRLDSRFLSQTGWLVCGRRAYWRPRRGKISMRVFDSEARIHVTCPVAVHDEVENRGSLVIKPFTLAVPYKFKIVIDELATGDFLICRGLQPSKRLREDYPFLGLGDTYYGAYIAQGKPKKTDRPSWWLGTPDDYRPVWVVLNCVNTSGVTVTTSGSTLMSRSRRFNVDVTNNTSKELAGAKLDWVNLDRYGTPVDHISSSVGVIYAGETIQSSFTVRLGPSSLKVDWRGFISAVRWGSPKHIHTAVRARIIGARSQIRVFVLNPPLQKREYMELASRVARQNRFGKSLVTFFDWEDALRGWDGSGDADGPDRAHWLCQVFVDRQRSQYKARNFSIPDEEITGIPQDRVIRD